MAHPFRALFMVAWGALSTSGFQVVPACGDGSPPALGHAAPLRELLRSWGYVAEAQALDDAKVCSVSSSEAMVTVDREVRIPRELSVVDSLAKIAHLSVHLAEGEALRSPASLECSPWLTRVLHEEARAHALEARIVKYYGGVPQMEPKGDADSKDAWTLSALEFLQDAIRDDGYFAGAWGGYMRRCPVNLAP